MKFSAAALSSIAVIGLLQTTFSNAASVRKAKGRVLNDGDDCLSITDYICSSDDYSTLCGAVKEQDLADALSSGEWTVFAPSDDVFKKNVDDIELYSDTDGAIIKFHVVKGKTLMFDDLICTEATDMLSGEESRTKCSKKGAEKFQTGGGNTESMPKIVDADISVCNGVIHGVDDLLLPKLRKTSGGGGGGAPVTDTDGDDAPDLVCKASARSQPKNDPWNACSLGFYPTPLTTLPRPPNIWQKSNCYDDPNSVAKFDLAIIGAGIGAAYLANQLRFGKEHDFTMALFEAGENVGGRLMSGFHSGALGLPVRPLDKVNNVAPPEYGGMRISPVYPLVFAQVVRMWEKNYAKDAPEGAACEKEFCEVLENVELCCYGLLTPMNVGRVVYHSTRDNLGERLKESSLTDTNPLYTEEGAATYSVADIANYDTFSPYTQCILLAVGAESHVLSNPSFKPDNAVAGFAELCSEPLCDTIEGFCGLCGLFPKGQEAAAVVSCTGYDTNPETQAIQGVIGLANEVVNINGKTFLYLFTVGYQRLAQSLLAGTELDSSSEYGDLAIAPLFQRKLVAIGIGPGDFDKAVDRARELAQKAVDKLMGKTDDEEDDGPTGPIQYLFEDGSMTTSNLGYLTMLPLDAVGNPYYDDVVGIKGMEPWYEPIVDITVPNQAFKAIIAWDDFSLARELNLEPCVVVKDRASGSGDCDRIILEGNRDGEPGPESQVVRQAWMWDYKQILLYTVGSNESPAGTDIVVGNDLGMEFLVQKAVAELQIAVNDLNITIPQPSWFRSKTWPEGSLMINWKIGSDSDAFSDAFRRPFGVDTNVWYGNSEMSADGSLHGWAEGAFAMVNVSYPEITEELDIIVLAKN